MTLLFMVLTALSLRGYPASAQDIDMNAVRSQEEFRWGLTAYHSTLYGEAVLSLERALSFKTDDPRTLQWLGFAYYRLGFEETALSLWEQVVASNAADATLTYLIDTLRYRRGVDREFEEPDRYVATFELAGRQPEFELFSRPASIYARREGGFYLASFAGNQVLRFDANAAVDRRFLGGVAGLDHPFDVVETAEGYVFVSEFLRNGIYRSDLNGQNSLRFGSRGTGEGQLLGPQYLAVDPAGYLYVSEAGNRRVSKFDFDGNFVLSFGAPSAGFPGFQNPTGIVVLDNRIFVNDQRRRSMYTFDSSGNYLGTVAKELFRSPEGLSIYKPDTLLVADTNGMKLFHVEQQTVSQIVDDSAGFVKLTKAVVDANGHILATDFTRNSISLFTGISHLYTGLLVEVVRVDASDFPRIITEVSVRTRSGDPIVGLDESNFLLTERSGSVSEPLMIEPETNLRARLSVLIEDSSRLDKSLEVVGDSLATLYESMRAIGGLSVYRAGSVPALVGDSTESRSTLVRRALSPGSSDADWRLDSAVKLGASELTGFPGARAVVLITSGRLANTAFEEYPPDVLAAYLRNNGIAFYCIYLSPDPEDRETLEYLCDESGGRSYYIYRPTGISEIVDRVLSHPTGRYFFQYDSQSRSDFGNAYIPVQAEVQFYRRSGRGSSAYFPPLEY